MHVFQFYIDLYNIIVHKSNIQVSFLDYNIYKTVFKLSERSLVSILDRHGRARALPIIKAVRPENAKPYASANVSKFKISRFSCLNVELNLSRC
jgi:hypothetical protein